MNQDERTATGDLFGFLLLCGTVIGGTLFFLWLFISFICAL